MSKITHMSDARITFEHTQRQNPTVCSWCEATCADGAVYIDGYCQPPLSVSQIRKLANWLKDRADQIEREHGNLRWLRGGAKFRSRRLHET